MRQIILLFIALSSVLAISSESDSLKKTIQIEIPGIGTAHIMEEELGEPIAAPTRIEVKIKCAKTKSVKNLGFFRGCKIDSHDYDKETKVLIIKILSARVVHNTGEVMCDRVDSKEIQLKSACK